MAASALRQLGYLDAMEWQISQIWSIGVIHELASSLSVSSTASTASLQVFVSSKASPSVEQELAKMPTVAVDKEDLWDRLGHRYSDYLYSLTWL